MDKYIGRLLDNRYEILEVLGTGGMAVVYKARCHRLNRLVAVKILKDDYLEDEEFRRRFHSESQAVAMFSHPNIVAVYDVSTSPTADYIVMELIDGITLKQYMEKKGVLNWKETLHFAIQIAKALEHAHSRGIVHRDIKPHNVMVLKNGSVKVTDFGIARMMSKGNTLTKEALGSVHYISPEQAKGGRVDNRSDIYSLGVVMYEMMSGRPPYDGESPVSVAIQHINGGAAMPSTLNPNIPGGLEQIIMKAMAHEPDDRYPTATAMLADLDEFRKDPAILFDYHTPPTDAVTNIPKPPLVLDPKTTAAAGGTVVRKTDSARRPPSAATGPVAQQPKRKSVDNRQAAAAAARRRAEEERKRNRTATIAIVVCSIVMLLAIGIILALAFNGGFTSQKVSVPNITGRLYEKLQEYPNFEIEDPPTTAYSDEVAAGLIISQTPEAGEKVAKGTTIRVVVSLGPADVGVTMPDVLDWERDEAERALKNQNMNLQIRFTEEYSDTVKEDCVIKTVPGVGERLTPNQTVTVVISLGREIVVRKMPDLADMTEAEARAALVNQQLDLQIAVENIFDSEIEEGYVVRSTPEAGGEIKTGQKVTVYISKGPELKQLPDVLECNIADAVSMLATAGFANYETEPVDTDQEKNTVVQILVDGIPVDPGEKLDVNTRITLTVSTGSLHPEITKDVTLPLRGVTAEGAKEITVTRDGKEVFKQTVEMGVDSVTLAGQTGAGTVYYEVFVTGVEGSKIEKVEF